MDVLQTQERNGFTAELFHDTDVESPRTWDCMGTFFGFHNRYQSPDTPPATDPQRARSIAESAGNICLPVWLYDHSGTSYRATVAGNPFHCPWDSGLFGFIYVSKEDVRREYGCKKVGSAIRRKVINVLKAEVENYSQWANGHVYRWSIEDADGDCLDSCGGYYSEADAWTDAKEALDTNAGTE